MATNKSNTALAVQNGTSSGMMPAEIAEKVLVGGDLARLTSEERLQYVAHVCESLGLNPATQPFSYITLSGKLTLYARKDATEQLRKLHGISITDLEERTVQDVYVVKARAVDRTGRTDTARGVVPIKGLQGDNLANALMKAETKAKRRVTLSICGLGVLDESELDTVQTTPPATAPAQPNPIDPNVYEGVNIVAAVPTTADGEILPSTAELADRWNEVAQAASEGGWIEELRSMWKQVCGDSSRRKFETQPPGTQYALVTEGERLAAKQAQTPKQTEQESADALFADVPGRAALDYSED
jgi:hypothetical protein